MKSENEGPDAFEDFIRDNGALYALRSNNAKIQTGNPAERCIQDVKCMSTKIMDRTGAPAFL
eukprot:1614057-Ditylum_brightwellii.AAC.1